MLELNHEPVTLPPRAAATVALLRDGADGLEVFLLKRHGLSDVLGGAYVFPGGKLDDGDAAPDLLARLDQSPDVLHAALADAELSAAQAAALHVAAVREAFEESGVLLAAADADGGTVDTASAMARLRAGQDFESLVRQMALRLATRSLVPWTRWITPRVPSVSSKRFDTRFFLATVPAGQHAVHDERETTESAWLTPRAALQRYHDRLIELAPPQIMSLAQLSRHASVAEALHEARGRPPPVIQPEPFQNEEGLRVLCYPGDARHPLCERAMPGPTRLTFRNRRFEADGGFEALFA